MNSGKLHTAAGRLHLKSELKAANVDTLSMFSIVLLLLLVGLGSMRCRREFRFRDFLSEVLGNRFDRPLRQPIVLWSLSPLIGKGCSEDIARVVMATGGLATHLLHGPQDALIVIGKGACIHS